jgi:ribosomal-protein-alanine N-acetyltransferase
MSAVPAQPLPARRPMTVADLGAVMAIEAQAYSHPWSHGNFVDSLAAGHIAEVLEDAAPIGYFVAMAGVEELHLLNLTVAPQHQRQGHGSALLAAVLGHARARHLATVWLEVRAGNALARALYARRGFAEVGLRRGYYPARRGREDAVLMRCDLAPPVLADAPLAQRRPAGEGRALD